MALILQHLKAIDAKMVAEHRLWLMKRVNALPADLQARLKKTSDAELSILQHPNLWSGARFPQTTVAPFEVDGTAANKNKAKSSPISEYISDSLESAIANSRQDLKQLAAFKQLQKDYDRFKAVLIEKSLLLAVNESLAFVNLDDRDLSDLKEFFTSNYALKLQTRTDSLNIHASVRQKCNRIRNRNNLTPEQSASLRQSEVLAKRLVDLYLDRTKKKTNTEQAVDSVSTATSAIALATGIPAAIFGIGGIFFPPLLVPAGILGLISFISYTSTAISAGKMAYESITFGRSPPTKELILTAIDIAIAPLAIFGGSLVSSIKGAVSHAKKLVDVIGGLWNNVGSNIFPDIFFTQEVVKDMYSFTSPQKEMLKHTVTATTWKNIQSRLLVDHDPGIAFDLKQNTKAISRSPKKDGQTTAKFGRGFAYVRLPASLKLTDKPSHLEHIESYHADILAWIASFLSKRGPKPASLIQAVKAYAALDSNTKVDIRLAKLQTLLDTYSVFEEETKASSSTGDVKKLFSNEIERIKQLQLQTQDELVLVGYKVPSAK